eukprot:scaffold556520_cov26-Prasinocladus_malaysianus.AAC.1
MELEFMSCLGQLTSPVSVQVRGVQSWKAGRMQGETLSMKSPVIALRKVIHLNFETARQESISRTFPASLV